MFGESHIEDVSANLGLRLLGKMPLDPSYAEAADNGLFYQMDNPYLEVAKDVLEKI